jgi:hypothetical protein
MKKNILFAVNLCICISTYAQDKSLNIRYYNAKLDSVIYKYSIGINKNPYSDIRDFYDANLSETDRKKIIIRIKQLFEQDKYSNLYSLARITLYDLWQIYPVKNTTKIKQSLLELFLKYYFYPGQRVYLISSDYNDLNITNNYTTASRKRIFDILKGEKTQEEYNAEILFQESIPVNVNSFKRAVEQTIKRQKIQDDSIIKKVTDSIYVEDMINYAKDILDEKQIESDLILMIGFLNMKECVPTLGEKLQEIIIKTTKNNRDEEYGVAIKTINIDHEQAYRFALAKLGDKTQRQYILDTFISTHYFDKKFLSYFRDDSITWKYIDDVYNSKAEFPNYSSYIPATIYAMDAVCPFIKDLPRELHNPHHQHHIQGMQKYYDWEKALHEWLMKNRDKVTFDYDGKKDWFWAD